jgi:hypothetical protein
MGVSDRQFIFFSQMNSKSLELTRKHRSHLTRLYDDS